MDKADAEYIKGFQLREMFHLTWWEYLKQPAWVNKADFALMLTRGKAMEKGA